MRHLWSLFAFGKIALSACSHVFIPMVEKCLRKCQQCLHPVQYNCVIAFHFDLSAYEYESFFFFSSPLKSSEDRSKVNATDVLKNEEKIDLDSAFFRVCVCVWQQVFSLIFFPSFNRNNRRFAIKFLHIWRFYGIIVKICLRPMWYAISISNTQFRW